MVPVGDAKGCPLQLRAASLSLEGPVCLALFSEEVVIILSSTANAGGQGLWNDSQGWPKCQLPLLFV